MTIFLTSENYEKIVEIEAKISENTGLPNNSGTQKWAEIKKAYNQDFWYIPKPTGYKCQCGEYTQEQMLKDIDFSEIEEKEFSSDWVEPNSDGL